MPSNIHVDACSNSQGNSRVELVVAVTMLGVIASFAIPRFTHLKNDVRASEVVALSVNLRSAAAAAHAQYLESGARLSTATMKGRTVRLKNGYPDAGADGIRAAIADPSGFAVSATSLSVSYAKTDAPAPAQCAVTYHASAATTSEATITDLQTGGC
jgi:MSHA pilin protein MshA